MKDQFNNLDLTTLKATLEKFKGVSQKDEHFSMHPDDILILIDEIEKLRKWKERSKKITAFAKAARMGKHDQKGI